MKQLRAFLQAFSEFLRRPKTVFDLKDRGILLVMLAAIVLVWNASFIGGNTGRTRRRGVYKCPVPLV
jgi:hypothetical protein